MSTEETNVQTTENQQDNQEEQKTNAVTESTGKTANTDVKCLDPHIQVISASFSKCWLFLLETHYHTSCFRKQPYSWRSY